MYPFKNYDVYYALLYELETEIKNTVIIINNTTKFQIKCTKNPY